MGSNPTTPTSRLTDPRPMVEMPERIEGPERRRADLLWRSGAFVVWLALTLRFWWVCDDAYISFRFGRNWAEGHGPRFNLGDAAPVEGYTNFLWMAASALAERAGVRPDLALPLLSCLCAALLLWRYHALLARHFALPPALAGLLLLGLAAFPPFALWSTSGMETMAQCLLLLLACEGLLIRRGSGIGAGLAGLGAALVRFDGIAWALAIGASALLAPSGRSAAGRRRLARYLGIVLTGFAVYYLWRFRYYDAALPNTVHAKLGFGPELLLRGLQYTASHVATFLSPLVLLAAAGPALRARWRDPGLPLLALAGAGFAYPILTGGDFMAMGRFLMPATIFLALLLIPLHAALAARSTPRACLLAGALVAVAQPGGLGFEPLPERAMAALHFRLNTAVVARRSELDQWRFMKRNTRLWTYQGLAMGAAAAPGESWVVGPLGATGYFSRLTVYDQVGLVVPAIARRARAGPLASPGHDTLVERTALLDLEPDYLAAWLWNGRCMVDPIEADLPARGIGGLRVPEVVSRYGPVMLPVARPGLPYPGVLVLLRMEDGLARDAAWQAFDADRPPPCVWGAARRPASGAGR